MMPNSNGNGGDNDEMKRKLQEKEAELRRMQEMVAKMQANLNGKDYKLICSTRRLG